MNRWNKKINQALSRIDDAIDIGSAEGFSESLNNYLNLIQKHPRKRDYEDRLMVRKCAWEAKLRTT